MKKAKEKKIDCKTFTIQELETELKRETYQSKYLKILSSTIYALVVVAAISALVATLVVPVLQIIGSSMTPTFIEGEIVFSVKTKKLNQGDIVAFYHGNKILIKRVIAESGSWVNITIDGDVYVNGVLLEEEYVKDKTLGETNITYPYQVPDGQWFVLGDHRETSIDSRNTEVGCISIDDIVGKIIFRVWPLNRFGKIY